MDITANCPIAATLAERLRAAKTELTARWLERISERVSLGAGKLFPSDELLDHVPLLMLGIADYLEDPGQSVSGDSAVLAKAMELGALRYAQGFDEYEILKEFEIFGGIVFAFLARTVDELEVPCTPSELMICSQRLYRAVALIQEATATQYLRLMKERLTEREERLRAFNRALTHEMRNRIGACMGAGQLLELPDLEAAKRQELASMVVRNADGMRIVLDNLLELTRLDGDSRHQRHVHLPKAAAEAARQLREMARASGVEIRVTDSLPDVEVNAAVLELALVNLLSNGIKYADSSKPARWIEVRGRMVEDGGSRHVVVEVYDNGVGVPANERAHLFERFFRTHGSVETGVEGTGLGLSIVREAVRALGGRAWAEFPETGSVFAFAIPCRRAPEAEGVDIKVERNPV
ncbi:MAG TPA: sensor histidine kinase [Gemmatimonadaceae bacterium]